MDLNTLLLKEHYPIIQAGIVRTLRELWEIIRVCRFKSFWGEWSGWEKIVSTTS